MNAIMQNFDKIFNASLIYATFRSATPIIFAALCAAIHPAGQYLKYRY